MSARPHLPSNRVLQVDNLSVRFESSERTVDAVRNLSFYVDRGETLTIVGESGSGKSVTSLALMRLVEQGGGKILSGAMTLRRRDGTQIELDRADSKTMRSVRGADMAMIFQEPMAALDPCFTVGYQLAEVVRLRGSWSESALQAKVIELLEQVKIPNAKEVAARYPHQISGGMAQRVGIARALASEPKVLLADEPTTALDVTVQAEILELLRSLSLSRHMAVILVTHDWGVVADLCDRAMVLRHGHVLESAPVLDLFQRPQHPYTQALLAANPHSATPGQVLPTVDDALMSLQGVNQQGARA